MSWRSAGLSPGRIWQFAENYRNSREIATLGLSISRMPYNAAKGLEFDAVILPYLSDDLFPDPQTIRDFGPQEAQANDGRLLYVGVTRARTALILTHCGTRCSLLPTDPSLYAMVSQ